MKNIITTTIKLAIIFFTVDTIMETKNSQAITYQPDKHCVQLLLHKDNPQQSDAQQAKTKHEAEQPERVTQNRERSETSDTYRANYWRR